MKLPVILSFVLFVSIGYSQDAAYTIFTKDGKKTTYKKMLKSLGENEVILFGELHNNPISHWLQLELTKSLDVENDLVLGAEMIEADNQDELDDYLKGVIDRKGLDSTARLWPNYRTDYKPLVDYAKEHNIAFVAANIPRRYANRVFRGGFEVLDTLPANEKAWIAPLPIEFDPQLPRYQYILEMMGDHGTPELVMAQAIKDATMAHFIYENMKSNSIFIHYNGAYHSDFYEGIYWYLKRKINAMNIGTITTVSQQDISTLEEDHLGRADFIICVDEDMTTTH